MGKSTNKTFRKTIFRFWITEFSDRHGKKSLSVRDLESKGSLTTYKVSSVLDKYESLKEIIVQAEANKNPIEIEYVKKYGNNYIHSVN